MKTIILVLLMAVPGLALELNGVKLEDTAKVAGKDLKLNGMAIRKVSRFGLSIKVYVGGLYLEKSSVDADATIKSDEQKRLVMEFVRSVDRKALIEAYRDGYENNCVVECDQKGLFTQFKNIVTAVKDDDQMIFDFYKDKVVVTSKGSTEKVTELNSATLSKNILAIFIGKIPPSKEFKEGLLSGSK